MKPIIAPSILSADFGYLAKDIEMVNRSEAEWVHIDIMDGVFVPNISFGFPVLKYVAKLSKKPLDVHLMIVNPEKFIPEVKALGAHTMNVHYETCPHLHRVVQQIREAGMQPAVTINPATPVALLQDIIRDVYMVLVMSVNPGFGGQKFIEHSVEKVRELRALIEQTGSKARCTLTIRRNMVSSPPTLFPNPYRGDWRWHTRIGVSPKSPRRQATWSWRMSMPRKPNTTNAI